MRQLCSIMRIPLLLWIVLGLPGIASVSHAGSMTLRQAVGSPHNHPVIPSGIPEAVAASERVIFSPTDSLNQCRFQHTATRVTNGQVLVVGGMAANYETICRWCHWDGEPAKAAADSMRSPFRHNGCG